MGSPFETAPRNLLRFHPARFMDVAPGETVTFDYELKDYLAAPRSQIENSRVVVEIGQVTSARLDLGQVKDARATLIYRIGSEASGVAVDLGQIMRGHRFAYLAAENARVAEGDAGMEKALMAHDAWSVLLLPGLVTATGGVHVLHAPNPLVRLALLGKIYPENVVLRREPGWAGVHGAGKGFGPKFVLDSVVEATV